MVNLKVINEANVSEMAEKEDVIARELTGVVSRFKLEEKEDGEN